MRRSIFASLSSFSFLYNSVWFCRDFSRSSVKFSRLRSSCCSSLLICPSKNKIFCFISSTSGTDWLFEFDKDNCSDKSRFFCSSRSTASRISTAMASYFSKFIASLCEISATSFCSCNFMSAVLRRSASSCLTFFSNSLSRIEKLVSKPVFHWRVSSKLLWRWSARSCSFWHSASCFFKLDSSS